MPAQVSSRVLMIRGTVLVIAGLMVRVFSGIVLDAYANYLGPTSSVEFSIVTHITGLLDAVLIPLGVAFIAGSYVVAALRGSHEPDQQQIVAERP